jgi:ABC-type antimicrobial peptide transport system permease subunit
MTFLEWSLSFFLFMIYLVCLFTVCRLTFMKGYTVLGILGIFMPLLWLIGAILPAKRGSRQDIADANRYRAQTQEFTR